MPGVRLDHFLQTPARRTFTYCKPLVLENGGPPRELSRLDSKNWTPTPEALQRALAESVMALAESVDAIILLEQTDLPETGVITRVVREAAHEALRRRPGLLVLADSRRGLRDFPPVAFKMNAAELCALLGETPPLNFERIAPCAAELARRNGQPVFVTVSENGMIGALPGGVVEHVPALPVRGPIDIVGAGDSVTANLTTALSAGATLREAMTLAMAAASVVVHQLGTTGTAKPAQIAERMRQS
jgi:bifunctional ADP-heptose synthase (sugar kinase/adenylyltransferase)